MDTGVAQRGEIRETVSVFDVHHRIDRYGRCYQYALEVPHPQSHPNDIDILSLDEETDIEDLVSLLSYGSSIGDIDVVVSKVKHYSDSADVDIYYLPDSTTLPAPRAMPKCKCCGHDLRETLGSLYCGNFTCSDRIINRIEYFVVNGSTPLEWDDLENIKHIVKSFTDDGGTSDTLFVDMILPDTRTKYGTYLFESEDTRLYLGMYYRKMMRDLQYCHGVDKYLHDVVQFVMDLSIPDILPNEVYRELEDYCQVGEQIYFFSKFANYLRDKNEVYYRPFIKELEELGSRVLLFCSD